MTVRRVFGGVVTVAVVLLLVQQMVTTYYLAKIDAGLNRSLRSTRDLAAVQTSIIEKNQALHGVVETTQALSKQLQMTLQSTAAVDQNIQQIDQLNIGTLGINGQLVDLGRSGQTSIAQIAASIQRLNQAMGGLHSDLKQLQSSVHTDQSLLGDMKTQTDEMNRKVPGVAS